jgi:non-specific serine/threonine protein kinase
VPESPGQDAAAAITTHVADRQVLLVLDNCEHLASAVARLAEQLLTGCPGMTIPATSREMLGVDGERNWPVPPLSLPDESVRPTQSALSEFDAVKLFEQRAQLIQPSFAVSDDNAAAVLTVCRRLDGLPTSGPVACSTCSSGLPTSRCCRRS